MHENEIRDANSLGRGAQLLQLSHLRLRLLPEKAVTDAWIGLPLTRITALHPDGRVDIDKDLIPAGGELPGQCADMHLAVVDQRSD
ncbi:type VI secretion system baseplate subunit TssK [Escherichia coli]